MSLLSGRINLPTWSYHCQKAGKIIPLGVLCCLILTMSSMGHLEPAWAFLHCCVIGHTESNIVIIALTSTTAQELSTRGISYLLPLPFSSEQGAQVRPQWFLLVWRYPKQMGYLGWWCLLSHPERRKFTLQPQIYATEKHLSWDFRDFLIFDF